ncbi:MAG: GLPGLI family protein [Bacteroidota bacterium]
MKTLVSLSFLFTFLIANTMYGQSIQGIATYKTQRKMDIQLDSTQMDDAMQAQIKAMMKKQFEKEYTLQFTEEESVYKEVEKLDSPGGAVGGMVVQVEMIGSGSGDVLYKNLKEGRYTNQTESFSKQFLIKDQREPREWNMEKETKNIGEYTCFKATHTYERTVMSRVSSSVNGDDENKEEEKKETVTLTAWYTPQIPVKNGPSEYGGLPGLILEISDGDLSILCSKVVLNPKDGLDIKEPKGGKKVTQEEYDAIMEKKMKEMEEQYERSSRRNDGDHIEIRIGG